MAKHVGAPFITFSEMTLEREELEALIEEAGEMNFPDEEATELVEAQWVRKYSGTSENARRSKSRWRQYRTEQSKGVNSHLCGFKTSESARLQPSRMRRISGTIAAEPPYAASTCSHIACGSQISTIAGTGSMLDVEVVPTVATTQKGRMPLRLSSSIASASAFVFMRN